MIIRRDEMKSEYRKSLNDQYYILMSEIYFTRAMLWLMIGAIVFNGVPGFVGIGFGIIGILMAIVYFVLSYDYKNKVV